MPKLEIKDAVYSIFELTAAVLPNVDGAEFENVLRELRLLHDALPMVGYEIARVGETDVWELTATAADAREYASTMTLENGDWKASLTSFPLGTVSEVFLLLTLSQLWTAVLKAYEVETVELIWN